MLQQRSRFPTPIFIALFVGLAGISRFAPGLRPVVVVGLVGSGAALGVARLRVVLWWRGRVRD